MTSVPNTPPPSTSPTPPEKAEMVQRGKPYKFRGEGSGLFQSFCWYGGQVVSWVVSKILFRASFLKTERIPRKGAVLMVSNHQSFLDPWLIGIFPPRQVHYMARDTLYKGGFFHWLMELLNAFPVKRGSADLGAIRHTVEMLNRGYLVNIFPEGTRTSDGTIGDVASGMSLILNRCKVDVTILPVVLDGAYEAWPRTEKYPSWTKIRIMVGQPILPVEWKKLKAGELGARVRDAFVELQREMGSVHVEKSAARAIAEKPAEGAPRERRVRGKKAEGESTHEGGSEPWGV